MNKLEKLLITGMIAGAIGFGAGLYAHKNYLTYTGGGSICSV